MKIPRRIGKPPAKNVPVLLLRALRPMLRQARALAGRVRTVADARAVGVRLRRDWPDKRLAAIVRSVGEPAEQQAGRGWAPLERATAKAKPLRGDSRAAYYSYDLGRWVDPSPRVDAKPRAYDGVKLVDRWTKEAAGKISSVRDEVAERLRRDVIAAAEAGTDPAELAARWVREGVPVKFGTLEGRMQVIARHQLSVLHAQVQSERARAVGVSEFIWRTQQDDRVRDEHEALDGERRAYGEGIEPGQEINCRCFAESVISDELLEAIGFGVEGVPVKE